MVQGFSSQLKMILFKCVDDLLVYIVDTLYINLDDFAVVGYKAINLALNIGGLGVDCRSHTLRHKLLELVGILDILSRNLVGVVELDVSPVALVPPEVILHRVANTAILAQDNDKVGVVERH